LNTRKEKIYNIIFEANDRSSKLFDIILLILIIVAILLTALESIGSISEKHGDLIVALEWIVTILFTIEYFVRIYVAPVKKKYIFSFFGIIDLIAIIPTYLSILFPGTQYLNVIRSFRLLRVFKVLHISSYFNESSKLYAAMKASSAKIIVFMFFILTSVVVIGSIMFLVEGPENGFDNIPISIYWGIVTLTTVGFGDITPQTPLGQFISGIVMILGYGIIAVPTGIVTSEMTKANTGSICHDCGTKSRDQSDKFCHNCGNNI